VVVFVQYFRRYAWMLRRSRTSDPEPLVEPSPDARVD
jgi:hypothetical protein